MNVSQALAVGLRLHQSGQLVQAEQVYRRILHSDPEHADAWHLLGVLANQQGQPAAAVEAIGRAIALRPDAAAFHNNLGLAYRALGRLAEARTCFDRAIELKPNYPQAFYNLGLVLRAAGQLADAIAAYRQALRLQPAMADAHNNLGVAWRESGRLDEAVASYQQAIRVQPDFAEAHYNLGRALKESGRLDEAVAAYRQALRLRPDYAEAHNNLGLALAEQKRLTEAAACYLQALRLKPDLAEAHNNLGSAFSAQGEFTAAAEQFRRAIALKPGVAEMHRNLGSALRHAGELTAALGELETAQALDAADAETENLLGNILKEQGRLEEALPHYDRALELDPEQADALSNMLLSRHYRPGLSPADLAAAHAAWDERFAAPLRSAGRAPANSRDPERPLRLGFVSCDFGNHPVGYFLVRTLEGLGATGAEVFIYSDRKRVDALTDRFRAAAGTWRESSDLSDEQLADQVRADRIDVLFDLAGHTYGHRLLVFARKPAPIQLSWIGYEGPTGLGAIDGLVADRHLIPPEAEACYPGRIVRLPQSYVSYDPPANAPPVGPLPALAAGHITLGSFNNPAKFNALVIASWAEILRQVPRARLVVKYQALDETPTADRLRRLFAQEGLDADRIEIQGWSSWPELMAQYQRLDLALDPFPFSGGATTCNALWMGVPVVTCPGQTFASRHGLSFLSTVGLTECIAADRSDYVRRAVALAGDHGRLAVLRADLRRRMAESPLCDGRHVARALYAELRPLWRMWCAGQPG